MAKAKVLVEWLRARLRWWAPLLLLVPIGLALGLWWANSGPRDAVLKAAYESASMPIAEVREQAGREAPSSAFHRWLGTAVMSDLRATGLSGGLVSIEDAWAERLTAGQIDYVVAWRQATEQIGAWSWSRFFARGMIVLGEADANGGRAGLYDPVTGVWLVMTVAGPETPDGAQVIRDLYLMTSARLLGEDASAVREPGWLRTLDAGAPAAVADSLEAQARRAMRAFRAQDLPAPDHADMQRALELVAYPYISLMQARAPGGVMEISERLRARWAEDGVMPARVVEAIEPMALVQQPQALLMSAHSAPNVLVVLPVGAETDGASPDPATVRDLDPVGLSLGDGRQSMNGPEAMQTAEDLIWKPAADDTSGARE